MLLHRPKRSQKATARQGALALCLGAFVELLAGMPVEVRAEQSAPLKEVGEGFLPPLRGQGVAAETRRLALPQPDLSPFEGLSSLRRVTYRVKAGDTLSKLLVRFGVAPQERKVWLQSIQKSLPLNAIRPGKEIQFYFTLPASTARGQKGKELLKGLEIDVNEDSILTWEKGNKGIVFSKREKPFDVELKTAGGVVDTSLIEDGSRLGLSSSVLSQLVDIFSWEIDFDKETQKGDTFKLLYEERSRRGNESKISFRILAAELINAGRQYFAIYFEKEKGKGGYYDLDGRSLARAFLRFPLEFTNITSTFSHSRFHPILKIDRPHHGVDFAAKRGTPVRAIGEGTIQFAGWKTGGYGRMIEVQHDTVYASRYAHLLKLSQGISNGGKVQKGQVIGYVGSSGLSTGAHLHFELYQDREYVDPLSFEFPAEDQIEPALVRVFENRKQLFLAELAATPLS